MSEKQPVVFPTSFREYIFTLRVRACQNKPDLFPDLFFSASPIRQITGRIIFHAGKIDVEWISGEINGGIWKFSGRRIY